MGQQLERLLQDCTVKLSIPGKMGWGTGFFVAPGLILTCYHVVKDAENGTVQVCWQNQEDFAEAEIERSLPEFDLALLRFSPLITDLPCVYLDESFQADDSLYTYGYPDDFPQGAPVTAKCEGMTGDEPPLIKFKAGQVRPGLSGSPLLNQRTGKVCGIVKFTRDRSFDLGGGAVPTSEILSQFPELLKLQREFHQQDDRWTKLLPRPPSQTRLVRQEYRNRQALLNKVRNFWVKGFLERSLYNQVLIELGLEERPDTLAQPWNMVLQTSDEEPTPLPQGTKVIDLFDEIGEGRTLLILGEPGSGKTTTLLELTRDLIARAEQDIERLIPVVLNLSSWAVKKQKIEDWLVEELNIKYQVPKKIGQALVKEDKLLLLLDGLDEVKAEYREQCITALNQFNQEYCPEIVVCSRIKDYEALSSRLNFQRAVYVRLLTLEQVRQNLNSLGSDVTGLRTLVEEDKALQELAQSPLMLNIMTLVYQGVAVEDLPKTDVVEEWQKQLFDEYIEKMFERPYRSKGDPRYSTSKTQAMRWLIWLAQQMFQEKQTIFLIEQMQPSLLANSILEKIYLIGVWLITGIAISLSSGMISKLYVFTEINEMLRSATALVIGITYAYIIAANKQIKIIGNLQFSPSLFWPGLIVFIITLLLNLQIQFQQFLEDLIGEFLLVIIFIGSIISLLALSRIKGVQNWFNKQLKKNIPKLPNFEYEENLESDLEQFFSSNLGKIVSWICVYLYFYLSKIDVLKDIIIGWLIIGCSSVLMFWFTPTDQWLEGDEVFWFPLFLMFLMFIVGLMIFTIFGLISSFLIGAFFLLSDDEIENTIYPNQGIYNTAKNSIALGFFSGISSFVLGSILSIILFYKYISISMLVFTWVFFGLNGILIGLVSLGRSCLQHIILRILLYLNGSIPWNYARFLDYATERIFLQKVGGGYIFIHRMLMEHFARMELNQR